MSEYDEPGRSDDPSRDARHPGRPEQSGDPEQAGDPERPGDPAHLDESTEDTAPLWATSGHEASRPSYPPAPYPPAAVPSQNQHDQHNPYGYPYRQPPVQPYGYPRPGMGPGTSRVPGWLWPAVAATALVVGLLGGTISGVVVSSSMNDGDGASFTGDTQAAAPLDPENGSVAAVAEQLLPSTVQINARNGDSGATGSGFLIDRSGHVITNNHVVADAASGRIQVIDYDGRAHSAEIVGRSPVYDIAVLKVEGVGSLRPAALGSSRSMNIGETVVALGSPLGLDNTVTSGIVSALDRPVTTGDSDGSSYINAVQTDAAINPGNSGGPLVNLRGEVVGVNSAIATTGGSFGESGNIGVGFAIPMEQVKITAAQILETGVAKYPVIGANVNTGDGRDGAEVVDVPAGTPAADGGLEEGDLVVAVDDVAVTDGIGLIVAIRSHQPGETVSLQVKRDGRELTVRVELDAKIG